MAGQTFSRSGPGPGNCFGRSRARAPRKESGLSPPTPTSPLPAWAARILRAPEAVSRNCPRSFPGAARGSSAGFQEAPTPPGGRSDPLPGPGACAPPPGDPLSPAASPAASPAPQDTPLRRPGLLVPPPPPPRPRPSRPAPRGAPGEPRAPTPPPERPARERDGGGDGDWAAARGRILDREARPPLSFSAPAPLSPPSLLAPPAAAEVGALASSPPPTRGPSPLLSPPSPPPLAASSSFPERLAERRRNGKPRLGEGCELGAGDAEPGPGELESPGPARAAGERARSPGQVGRAARVGGTEPPGREELGLRARRLAREPGSRAPGAHGEGRGPSPGPGRVSDAGNGRERLLLFSPPRPPAAEVEKLCLERQFAGKPARAELSRRRWRAPTGGSRGHRGARLWAQPGAEVRALGTAPRGPRGGRPGKAWCVSLGHAGHRRQLLSNLGCIFVGSAVNWVAGWRRWAWSGEDHIWDGWLSP